MDLNWPGIKIPLSRSAAINRYRAALELFAGIDCYVI